jgi:cytochrome c oxidase subunit 2
MSKNVVRLTSTFFALLALGAVSSSALAAGDAAKGKSFYVTCQACHGANAEGNKALNAPALTGLEDWYIERQLKNFKAGIRGADPKDTYGIQMRPMAMILPDDQAIADVAAYLVSLK